MRALFFCAGRRTAISGLMQSVRAGTLVRTVLVVSCRYRRSPQGPPRGRSPDLPLDAKGAALSSRHPPTLRTPFASTLGLAVVPEDDRERPRHVGELAEEAHADIRAVLLQQQIGRAHV